MSEAQTSMDHHVTDPHMADHPSPRKYVNVAIILGIVTAIEVAIYYVSALEDLLVPILMVLAVIKFVMVGMYFMHLKFDSHTFRRFFVTGIVLALFVFGVVMTLFFSRGGPAPGVGG